LIVTFISVTICKFDIFFCNSLDSSRERP